MIIVLFESPSNIILSVVDKMKKGFPKSSIQYIGAEEKVTDILAKFQRKPLFSKGWLIECAVKVPVGVIQKLDSDTNVIVVRTTSAQARDELLKKLPPETKLIDNYIPQREDVVEWIEEELKCGYYLANMIYTRTKGRLPQVMESVGILSLQDNVTEYSIKRFVQQNKKVSLQDVVQFLLGIQRGSVKKQDVLRVIKGYQYAISFLIPFLIKQLDFYVLVFQYALSEELSLVNYREFYETSQEEGISELSVYQLKRILEAFGKVSLRYILYVRGKLGALDVKDQLSVYKLIMLIKIGG